MGLTATLNLHLAGLHSRLAVSIGLTEAVGSALSQKALPIMIRAVCKADSLGSAENVWTMCQQFYRAQAHTNLQELTRPDSGWPEHRRHLAQTLLSTGRFIALTEHYAPATPDRAGQWLGCLALATLAVVGQCAAENELDAAGLQNWLHQQPLGLNEPLAEVAELAAAAQSLRAPAKATTTAPWWPLVALAVVGIGASSYFWQQQTATPTPGSPKATTALTAARIPAPLLDNQSVALPAAALAAGATAATRPAEIAAPGRVKRTLSPDLAVAHSGAARRVAPRAIHHTSSAPDNDNHKSLRLRERNRPLPPPALPEDAASTEALLYKRLANPESGSRKPIDLDHLSFAHGQAALDPEGTKQLSSIANMLKTFPHYRLIVFGNAESSEPNSAGLALDRANTVIAELVKQGVPSTALQAQGHLRPTADKADDATAKRRPALYISSLE